MNGGRLYSTNISESWLLWRGWVSLSLNEWRPLIFLQYISQMVRSCIYSCLGPGWRLGNVCQLWLLDGTQSNSTFKQPLGFHTEILLSATMFPLAVGTTTLNCKNTRLHYTALHYTALQYTKLHYITLHYTTLHYITLHYTTLHYTTLHYSTI